MAEQILYKKVGSRYVECKYYDSERLDSFTEGSHLIIKKKGSKACYYNVRPDIVPLIAAGKYAADAVIKGMHKAAEARLSTIPVTEEERVAWDNLQKAMGETRFYLQYDSIQAIADAGVAALVEETEKLMHNETVRAAYEHFLLVCELSKKEKEL